MLKKHGIEFSTDPNLTFVQKLSNLYKIGCYYPMRIGVSRTNKEKGPHECFYLLKAVVNTKMDDAMFYMQEF